MKKSITTFLLFAFGICTLVAQSASLSGKVTESETGDPVLFASIALYQNGVLRTGTESDFDGNYSFANLDPGTYDLEVHYLGLKSVRVEQVQIFAGKAITLDVEMSSDGGILLDAVQVIAYRVPLIEQDNSTQGYTLTTEQIRSLPARDINGLAAHSAGLSQSKGDNFNVRGSRGPATHYYLDGQRVGSNLVPTVTTPNTPPPPIQQDESEFSERVENDYLKAQEERFSTFGVDVDRAAYSIVRSYLNRGQLPPTEVIRTEEMVNYFEYDYLQPDDGHPFAVHSELAICPWDAEHLLLSVALQGEDKSLDEMPASNLTFLLDVSGSMGAQNKLPLVKESIRFLIERLRPEDQVAFVVYAGAAGVVLSPTKVSKKEEILSALERLQAGGGTAGEAGIRLAYELAREYFIEGGNNRVILATDGDFNVGISSPDDLESLIEKEKESGVFLTTLGFGMGNFKDNRMERLADKGNGMYAYIDTPEEAKKVFGEELTGSLYTIAKDVKLQLEFSPNTVQSYRLIGYENRLLAKEDFDDDTKDAGEIGAGHSVTALYEIVPVSVEEEEVLLGSLELRYKQPDVEQSQLLTHDLTTEVRTYEETSCNFRWASAIAAYSLLLQDSEYQGNCNLKLVRTIAENSVGDDPYGTRRAFLNQLTTTDELWARTGQN